MKLLCDEMLHRLGRWLRAAGYDTAIASGGAADAELLRAAAEESRVLLTRDRELAARKRQPCRIVGLRQAGLAATARALSERLPIDWLHAPFTRCLVDNAPLRPAGPVEAALAPTDVSANIGAITRCPECGRLYWRGGHVARMTAQLANWQNAG
ncbi:MAG TPA: DUF5615 family PIN-like protein [Stellaceae bacterium]|jgi:hypothetical protein